MLIFAHSGITQKQKIGLKARRLCKTGKMRFLSRAKNSEPSLPGFLSPGLSVCGLALALSACVYVPVVDAPDAASASCNTYTKSMSLDTIQMQGNITVYPGCNSRDCAAAVLASAVVVTAGSVLISGSIVLTGNTLHWLEYQGTCSDGYLNRAKQSFLATIGQAKPAEPAEKGK